MAPGKLRQLVLKTQEDGELYRCLNESQMSLANDLLPVSPTPPLSSVSVKWIGQRELDVTNLASAVFNILQE
jgi:hypothetical protein